MKRLVSTLKFRVYVAASASLLVLGSCALTDQQITSIAESAISTGLNSLIRSFFDALVGTNTA